MLNFLSNKLLLYINLTIKKLMEQAEDFDRYFLQITPSYLLNNLACCEKKYFAYGSNLADMSRCIVS